MNQTMTQMLPKFDQDTNDGKAGLNQLAKAAMHNTQHNQFFSRQHSSLAVEKNA